MPPAVDRRGDRGAHRRAGGAPGGEAVVARLERRDRRVESRPGFRSAQSGLRLTRRAVRPRGRAGSRPCRPAP
jgi:hypothetical protein